MFVDGSDDDDDTTILDFNSRISDIFDDEPPSDKANPMKVMYAYSIEREVVGNICIYRIVVIYAYIE